MELLDRYLQAVKKHLPWKRQDDIIAELRANLESQLEEKEAELGRPLTDAEAEAWLKGIGAPLHVAARYQAQQYLIGPGLFPIYWFVMRIAAVWSMAIYAIVSVIQIAVHVSGHSATAEATAQVLAESIIEALVRAPFTLMNVAAWITLVFAAIEFAMARDLVKLPAGSRLQPDWNPRDLPPVEADPAGGKGPRSYAHAVAEVVFGLIFLAWMLLIPWHPFLLLGPGVYAVRTLPYALAPIWWTFFWWIVALNAVQLAWRCIDLLRDRYQGPRLAQHLVVKFFGLVPMAILLSEKNHVYVLLKESAGTRAPLAVPLNQINDGIFKAFAVIFAIATAQLLWDLWKAGYEDWKRRAGGMK
jgi:hypothetical protein